MPHAKIHILHLIDILMGKNCMAGTERHLYQLASRLDPARFRMSVVRFDPRDGFVAERLREIGVPVHDLPVGRYYDWNALRQARRLRSLIRESDPDIVQTFHFKSDTYGVLVARSAGARCIVSSRRDMGHLRKKIQLPLLRAADRCVDRFLVNADAIRQRMTVEERIDPSRITRIYNGVDLDTFSPNGTGAREAMRAELGLEPDTCAVGYVAHFRPEKGHGVLFEALRRALPRAPKLRLLLIGWGPLWEHYQEFVAARPEFGSSVRFLGQLTDVERYLPALDVACLVPVSNEGFSNSILEAMAMGKPVVATDVGGNAESVTERTGLLVPPGDPGALADALVRLYDDPGLRGQLGRAARRRIESEFSLDGMVRRYEEFYRRTVLAPAMQRAS